MKKILFGLLATIGSIPIVFYLPSDLKHMVFITFVIMWIIIAKTMKPTTKCYDCNGKFIGYENKKGEIK